MRRKFLGGREGRTADLRGWTQMSGKAVVFVFCFFSVFSVGPVSKIFLVDRDHGKCGGDLSFSIGGDGG